MKEFNRDGQHLIISRFGVSENCVRIINSKFWLNDSGMSLHVKSNTELLQNYINYYIIKNLQEKIFNLSKGSCQKNINIDDLKKIEIPIPSPEIQSQIVAQCESIDCLIATLTREIETIESSGTLNKMLEAITSSNAEGAAAGAASADEIVGSVGDGVNVDVVASGSSDSIKPKKRINAKPIIKKSSGVVPEPEIQE